ncbi:MAG TPA: GNAT family N-acetyltransferase [Opitutaceae bacterium]|nr:GNAT family N-acetyltransferase [Opitutaceae bacterium]
MTAADIPAALELWRVTEGMGLGDSDRPERLAAFLERNPDLSAVAEEGNGTLIGAVLCGDDGRRGYLHHLAVQRERRKLGIARALLAHCFAGLRVREIEKCNIFLLSSNIEGERFWRREGWVVRDNLKVMQKNVADAKRVECGCTC